MSEQTISEQINALIRSGAADLESLFSNYDLTVEQYIFVYDWFLQKHPFHIIETAVRAGVSLKKTETRSTGPLWYAAQSLNLWYLKKLIQLGAELNVISHYDPNDELVGWGTAPLDDLADNFHIANSSAEREAADALWHYLKSIGGNHKEDLFNDKDLNNETSE